MELWKPQAKLVSGFHEAVVAGKSRILGVLPTGGGKTRVAATVIRDYLDLGKRVAFYTNRKALLSQSSKNFAGFELEHGVRASGHDLERWKPFQLCSIQTELTRMDNRKDWQLHECDLAIIDEAHLNASPRMLEVLNHHVNRGAVGLGLTATPIGLGHMYDHMVIGGTTSDARACGALVVAIHFGPDEPDFRRMGAKIEDGKDLTKNEARKAMMTPTIFGRVWDWWNRCNPEGRPTIGFAPGVAESIEFMEDFRRRGANAAHIDGDDVYIDGRLFPNDIVARRELEDRHREGDIKVVWNRFVMREGIDWPWAECGILATAFGSLQSYLQSGGRLMRASPSTGKKRCIIIDHGGNWHRHGSLNEDREWSLDYTASMITGVRIDRMRDKLVKEPFRCPKCALIMRSRTCPNCGNEITRPKRVVIQIDGTPVELHGDIYRPRKVDDRPDVVKRWEAIYWRGRKAGMSFRQMLGLYAYENDWKHAPKGLPLQPKDEMDWYRLAKDVPFDRLHPGRKGEG